MTPTSGLSALLAGLLLAASPAAAQDIRGLEVCTAEKQMERRTGCLQANVELLHQLLLKTTRETNAKLAAAERDLAAARAEIAALEIGARQVRGRTGGAEEDGNQEAVTQPGPAGPRSIGRQRRRSLFSLIRTEAGWPGSFKRLTGVMCGRSP